ncbi:MAG: NAD(P)H-binding protein [Gammaproteobacteria bacterium]|nr:NAD(P)H-binding protein [Gammaproteobacteria bacterium]
MQVAIIGGTGFVGSYLTDGLLSAGHSVSMLVRRGSESKLRSAERVRTVTGDIADSASIRRLLEGCDAVIYNVGILREVKRTGNTYEATQYQGVVNTVNAALEVGVRRLLLMSANGVKVPGTPYQETKCRAEAFALESGLDVTVFRPSVIFGDPRGTMEFATQLFREMVRPPVPSVNFVTGGGVVMSPIHVKDVADAFLAALEKDECIGKTYVLGGPEALSWKQMVSRIAQAAGREKWFLPMPMGLMRIGATLFDWLPFFPVTRDQLTMLEEGNVADPAVVKNLIGREPRAFDAGSLQYLGNQA